MARNELVLTALWNNNNGVSNGRASLLAGSS
jgi:hypothetical protein